MVTRETSLRDIFYPQGTGMPASDFVKAMPQQKLRVMLPNFGTEMQEAVYQDMRASTDRILQMTPLDILTEAWKNYREVAKLLEDSRQKPDDPILKPLVKHTVKSVHRPFVELSMGETPLWKVVFEITAALEVEGVMLKIQAGRITELLTGTAAGKFKLSSSGLLLKEVPTNKFTLPGEIRLKPAFPQREKTLASQPCLIGLRGEVAKMEFPLEDQMVIGRSSGSAILLQEEAVSHFHAQLSKSGAQWLIEDMGSAAGSYVNGKRVDSIPLKDGDRIRIGNSEFQFRE